MPRVEGKELRSRLLGIQDEESVLSGALGAAHCAWEDTAWTRGTYASSLAVLENCGRAANGVLRLERNAPFRRVDVSAAH